MNELKIDGAVWCNVGSSDMACFLWMQILTSVRSTGSISGTAQQLGTSYSRVYNEIVKLNCAAGKKLIVSARGGVGGGFAELTPEGEKVLELFTQAEQRFGQFLGELNHELQTFF